MKILTSLILTLCFSIASAAIDLGFPTTVTTLAVANTRQLILSTTSNAFNFIIQNPSTNIVSIFVGDSGVTTSGAGLGIEIVPGASLSLSSIDNLTSAKIFMVSTGTAIPVVVGVLK